MTSGTGANTMKRLRIVGVLVAVGGIALAGAGFAYGMPQANDGLASAQKMYEAQGVTLSYNDKGQLVDHNSVEDAQAIMALLAHDWGYKVNQKNMDPKNPVVNTRDELMYEYATLTYHVMHSKVTVKLADKDVPITYRGVTYDKAGDYPIEVGKYYAQLDRANPIEKQLRDAWTPQYLGLTATLAAAHANQAAGELAQATTLAIGGIGLLFAAAGVGLVWVTVGSRSNAPRGSPAASGHSMADK